MLLTNLITAVTGRTGIGAGVVVHVASSTLSIGIAMIQRKAMIKRGITEIRRILMATGTGSRKVVRRRLMTGNTILAADKTVIKIHIAEIIGV